MFKVNFKDESNNNKNMMYILTIILIMITENSILILVNKTLSWLVTLLYRKSIEINGETLI